MTTTETINFEAIELWLQYNDGKHADIMIGFARSQQQLDALYIEARKTYADVLKNDSAKLVEGDDEDY